VFKKIFTAAWMVLLFTFCHLASAASNVSVTATPTNPTAPATVTLAASGDSDGNPIMVTKVEYFNGTTSLGVSVQSPFTLTLNNLSAGTYQISVKVTTTDPANPVLQSAPLEVTVGAAPSTATAYFIHTDQLNTPRAITDSSGNLVWQWDSDPFGKDAANEQPAGQPAFTFNQRFPGQQFDRETNLHYNYFRDYDPSLGRYIQSDPIGLRGGINTFGYVEGRPTSRVDPKGLQSILACGNPANAVACAEAGIVTAPKPAVTVPSSWFSRIVEMCLPKESDREKQCKAKFDAETKACDAAWNLGARWGKACEARAQDRYRLCLRGQAGGPPPWSPEEMPE